MMKRSHLNLALLVVAGGLGAAVWFGQKKEEKGPPLTSLEQASITRLALEYPGQPAVRKGTVREAERFRDALKALIDRSTKTALPSEVGRK